MRKIRVITAVLLLFAILPVQYDYYIILRIIVTLVAGLSSFNAYKIDDNEWALIFLFIALLWNPIIPVYLNKSIWVVLDLVGASIFFTYNPKPKYE